MTDTPHRPGDIPPPEAHRATPGLRGDTADPGARAPGAEATPTAPDGERSPLVGEHPQPGDSPAAATGAPYEGDRTPTPRLLPHDDTDQLTAELRHAVAGFVDAPRDAVREADHVLEELTARFTDAVTERRRTLRRSWQTADTGESGTVAATDTEQLRLALRDYRELAERLLRV